MKKGKEVIIKIQDLPQLETYIDPLFNKLVIMNAYEKFWGPIEIIDYMIRRILDEDGNNEKMSFISLDKNLNPELFGKFVFTSKPAFFIFHRGTFLEVVDTLDLPKLMEKLEKHITLL